MSFGDMIVNITCTCTRLVHVKDKGLTLGRRLWHK